MNSNSNSKNNKGNIPNKYENAKNIYINEKNLDDSELSIASNELMKDIDREAKKIKNNINQKDLKILSKYENLTEDQLIKLIKERNENLIKLSDQKDKSKKSLNKIIKNLNSALSTNADLLCKDESDIETVNELMKKLELKKKSLKIAKNMNQSSKNHYNSLISKISGNNNGKGENKTEIETQLIGLKNENKNLELEIRKYKDDEISKQKELEIICEDKIYPAKIKMKSDENTNLLNQKKEYQRKINMSLNSIKNLIKEVNYLKQIYSEYKNKDKEKLENKMNFWIEVIKSDLEGTDKDIISRILKNETKFIDEVDKKENNYNNSLTDKVRCSSPNLNENRFINISLKKINNLELDETENNKYNSKIINKGKNSKLLYSQKTEKNISSKTKNIISPKGVFGKFNYLKQKPNTSESKSNKNNRDITSPEEKLSEEKIENIIQKDYNDTTDEDFRQLLEKKSKYLETNLRLEDNIKKIQRTINKKYESISQVVQDNNERLELLKAKNELLQKEISNLNNVYQLTVEQEKIKYDLKQKENKIKQEKPKDKIVINSNNLDSSSVTEKAILNELKENNILPQKNNNKTGNIIEITENKNDNETREEKLQKIKKKYRDMNDDNIDEIEMNEE